LSEDQLTAKVGKVEPRRRLLALVKAEAFAPYVQRRGEQYRLNMGDAAWFWQNVNCQVACQRIPMCHATSPSLLMATAMRPTPSTGSPTFSRIS